MSGSIERGRSRRWIALLVGLATAACAGGDTVGPENDANGSSTVTVTGAVSASFTGYAWQSGTIADPDTNEQGWVLFLGTSNPGDGNSIFVVRMGERPGNGTHSLIDLTTNGDLENGQFGSIATVGVSGGRVFAGFSSGGTITITSSSDSRVKGTFSYQITGSDPDNPGQEVTATLAGSFDAIRNTVAWGGF